MAGIGATPEGTEEGTGATSQTPRVAATRGEVAESMAQYAEVLVGQIQAMETNTLELVRSFEGSYSKQLLLQQIVLERIYANLGVFVRDFTGKYSFGYYKTQDPELLQLIRLTQIQLDTKFEQAKKNIETYIDQHFQ